MTLDECIEYYKETGCVNYDTYHQGIYLIATLRYDELYEYRWEYTGDDWLYQADDDELAELEWSVW